MIDKSCELRAVSCELRAFINAKNNWVLFLKYLAEKLTTVIFAVLKRKRRVGQGVKTPPFHGGITGSNPVRGTNPRFIGVFLCL